MAGHEPPTNQEGVKAVLRGIRRTIGAAREGKAPATADVLKAVLALCPDTLAGKRDRALLALGFAGAFRRSELVALRLEILPRRRTSCGSRFAAARRTRKGRGPRWRSSWLPAAPVEAVQTWMAAAEILHRPVSARCGALADNSAARS